MFSFLWGCVTIQVEGPGLDKWLLCAQKEGIPLRHLRRDRYASLQADIALGDLTRARALCGDRIALREVARRGLQPLLLLLGRELPILVCIAAALFAMGWGQSRLWEVTVQSDDPILRGRLRSQLEASGIGPGTPIAALDLRALERELQLAFPELRFVQTDLTGTVLTLSPIPLEDTPSADPAQGGDLVASHDAVIGKVTVRSGTARVEPGDQVRQGAVLIEGITSPTPDLAEPQAVPARGEVLARVWVSATAASTAESYAAPQEALRRYSLRLGSLTVPLGQGDESLTWHTRALWRLPGPWKRSPMALLVHTAFPRREYPLEEASQIRVLAAQAAREALSQLPADARILHISESNHRDAAGLLCVQTLIEAEMEIAVYPQS